MNNQLVNVLISAYNGEKYIEEQIESIKAQTYKNIKIYVRDDGSTDHTVAILEQYEQKGEIVLIKGDNVRWGKSFMTLLKESKEGEYWAFSDQDDVWMPEKIQWAVEWLEQQDSEKPLLYHSAYYLMNEDLTKEIGTYTVPQYTFDFRRSLTDCLFQGFSIVMNRKLRDMMLEANLDVITSHDWWACLLVTEYGEFYFDPRISSQHRRLEQSMSGGHLKSKIKWFIKTMKSGSSDITGCAKEFVRLHSDANPEDVKIVKWFANDNYHFIYALKKAFYPKRWRANMSSEISIRILMLLGKI